QVGFRWSCRGWPSNRARRPRAQGAIRPDPLRGKIREAVSHRRSGHVDRNPQRAECVAAEASGQWTSNGALKFASLQDNPPTVLGRNMHELSDMEPLLTRPDPKQLRPGPSGFFEFRCGRPFSERHRADPKSVRRESAAPPGNVACLVGTYGSNMVV